MKNDPRSVPGKTHDYDQFAGEYADLGFEGTFYLGFRDVPALLQKYANGHRALDYGCGPGRSTRFLRSLGLDTVGVDISGEMLLSARQQDQKGEYHQVVSGTLPFGDGAFDVVFSSFVFIEVSSLGEIARIFQEIKRVLKPDGCCVIVVTAPREGFKRNWVSFSYDFPENKDSTMSGEIVKLQIRGTDVVLYDYYWSDEDYRSAFQQAGLTVAELHMPLGRDEDPIDWLDEKEFQYILVYVLRPSEHGGAPG